MTTMSVREGAMSVREGASELEAVRHDFRNILAAFRSGCMLIEDRLGEGGHQEIRVFLREMRASADKGSALVERLRRFELDALGAGQTGAEHSGHPAREFGEG
jgi:hypothetical protein